MSLNNGGLHIIYISPRKHCNSNNNNYYYNSRRLRNAKIPIGRQIDISQGDDGIGRPLKGFLWTQLTKALALLTMRMTNGVWRGSVLCKQTHKLRALYFAQN